MNEADGAQRSRQLPGRLFALALGAATVGALLGFLEGAVYPSVEGPRIPLALYWSILSATMLVGLFGFARLVLPAAPVALAQAFLLLPFAVVVQDAASLHLQGMTPWGTQWYAEVFGHTFLTRHAWGLPGFYTWFTVTSLLGSAMLLLAHRPRRRRHLAIFDIVQRPAPRAPLRRAAADLARRWGQAFEHVPPTPAAPPHATHAAADGAAHVVLHGPDRAARTHASAEPPAAPAHHRPK